jgi:hypothetical protein
LITEPLTPTATIPPEEGEDGGAGAPTPSPTTDATEAPLPLTPTATLPPSELETEPEPETAQPPTQLTPRPTWTPLPTDAPVVERPPTDWPLVLALLLQGAALLLGFAAFLRRASG